MLSFPLKEAENQPSDSNSPEQESVPVLKNLYIPAAELQKMRSELLAHLSKLGKDKAAYVEALDSIEKNINQATLTVNIINGLLKKSIAI